MNDVLARGQTQAGSHCCSLTSVVIDVVKCYAVVFLQMDEPAGDRNILEMFALDVAKHAIGHWRLLGRDIYSLRVIKQIL